MRNDERNPRVSVSRIAATTPSRVSRSFSSVSAPRLSNGTVGSGTSPRGALATRSRRSSASDTFVRSETDESSTSAVVAFVASFAPSVRLVESTGAMIASASTNPACRAAMLIVAGRIPGASGGTAAGASTPPSSPKPRPHAASAAAAHAAVDAGRNPSATSPPASAIPPTATVDPLREPGNEAAHDDRADRQRRDDDRARDRRPAPHDDEEEHRQEERADQRAVEREEAGVREAGVRSPLRPRRSLDRADAAIVTAMSASAASGAWSKKMLRQLKSCVRNPPSAGPTATPIVPASPHTRIACSSLPRIPASTGTAPTSASAAPNPCTVRPTISISNEVANPHDNDAAANTPRPIPASTCPRIRCSIASTPSAPTTIARLYAVIVHETVTIDTSNVL